MADYNNRYPQNVPGKFYVDDQCLDHDLCAMTCPKHFKRDEKGAHYYVYQQPETPEEVTLCLKAAAECPVEAIGTDGDLWESALPKQKSWWRIW